MILEVAKKYHSFGLNILKIFGDSKERPSNKSKKAPAGSWKKWQTERQTIEDVERLGIEEAIGVVTGLGLEVIDIDVYDPKRQEALISEAKDKLRKLGFDAENVFSRIVPAITGSGGLHLIYGTDNPEGNRKLYSEGSKEDGKPNFIVETRGIGGQIVVPPSIMTDEETGEVKEYLWAENRDFSHVGKLTHKERDALIESFTNYRKSVHVDRSSSTKAVFDGKSSSEDYDERGDERSLLESHGWRFLYHNGEYDQYTRPGTGSGDNHAGWNRSKRFFHVFTTSDWKLDSNRGLTLTQLRCKLEFNDDFVLTIKALTSEGFGNFKPTITHTNAHTPTLPAEQRANIIDTSDFKDLRLKITDPIPAHDYKIKMVVNGKTYNLSGKGEIGCFTGFAKSRKTGVLKGLAAAALKLPQKDPILNFQVDIGSEKVLWFDTEQSTRRARNVQKNIYTLSDLDHKEDNERFHFYPLRVLKNPKVRFEYVKEIIKHTDNVGIICLDGIVDLVTDYNDQKESRAVIDWVMEVTESKNCIFCPVLHLAQTTGQLRGHLGTEIRNKADWVIKTTKLGEDYTDQTEVSNPVSRDINFPKWEFWQLPDGTPCLEDDWRSHNIATLNRGFIDPTNDKGRNIDTSTVPAPVFYGQEKISPIDREDFSSLFS